MQERVAPTERYQPVAGKPVLPAVAGTDTNGDFGFLSQVGQGFIGKDVDDGSGPVVAQDSNLGGLRLSEQVVEIQEIIDPRASGGHGCGVGTADEHHPTTGKLLLQAPGHWQGQDHIADGVGAGHEEGWTNFQTHASARSVRVFSLANFKNTPQAEMLAIHRPAKPSSRPSRKK